MADAATLPLTDHHAALEVAAVLASAVENQGVPACYAEASLGIGDLLGDIRTLSQLLLQHAPIPLLREFLPMIWSAHTCPNATAARKHGNVRVRRRAATLARRGHRAPIWLYRRTTMVV